MSRFLHQLLTIFQTWYWRIRILPTDEGAPSPSATNYIPIWFCAFIFVCVLLGFFLWLPKRQESYWHRPRKVLETCFWRFRCRARIILLVDTTAAGPISIVSLRNPTLRTIGQSLLLLVFLRWRLSVGSAVCTTRGCEKSWTALDWRRLI